MQPNNKGLIQKLTRITNSQQITPSRDADLANAHHVVGSISTVALIYNVSMFEQESYWTKQIIHFPISAAYFRMGH